MPKMKVSYESLSDRMVNTESILVLTKNKTINFDQEVFLTALLENQQTIMAALIGLGIDPEHEEK